MDTAEDPYFGGPVTTRVGDLVISEPEPPSRRRRGRPPAERETRVRELRLTPPDGQPVTDWFVGDPGITKLLACEEGGTGTDKALHYHAIIETTLTDDALKGWIRRVLRITPFTSMGNKVYRTGEPHEHSYGYVCKHAQVKCSFGYTDEQVARYIIESDEYRRDVLRQRQALQRLRSQGREKQLKTIEEITQNMLIQHPELYLGSESIVQMYLEECDRANIVFPTRTQMESIVNRIRWNTHRDRGAVVEYYMRGLRTFSA